MIEPTVHYELDESRGREPDQDEQDWLRAEQDEQEWLRGEQPPTIRRDRRHLPPLRLRAALEGYPCIA